MKLIYAKCNNVSMIFRREKDWESKVGKGRRYIVEWRMRNGKGYINGCWKEKKRKWN